MKTYELSTISDLFGLTNQQLRERLKALRPLLNNNGSSSVNEEILQLDEYGLRLLCYLDKLMVDDSEDTQSKEVGRAAHLVVGRE